MQRKELWGHVRDILEILVLVILIILICEGISHCQINKKEKKREEEKIVTIVEEVQEQVAQVEVKQIQEEIVTEVYDEQKELQEQLEKRQEEIVEVQQVEQIEVSDKQKEMQEQLEKQQEIISRGNVGRKMIFEVTAYTLREEECGKSPDDPYYGITASGKKVKAWHTVAAPKNIPFGTKIYIPYFKDKPNKGIFVVEDRGGAIKGNRLDVYMESLSEALKFGRRKLEVYILD